MSETIDPAFLLWFAGFIDGEGCFNITLGKGSRRGNHRPIVIITNTHAGVLREIASVVGGAFYTCGGGVRRKQLYQWQIGGPGAVALAATLAPILRVKRPAAEVLTAFPVGRPDPGASWRGVAISDEVWAERERLRLELRRLNRKGLPVADDDGFLSADSTNLDEQAG